jgi:outer membrane protein OmpA-like peptidoglycan-associated protein
MRMLPGADPAAAPPVGAPTAPAALPPVEAVKARTPPPALPAPLPPGVDPDAAVKPPTAPVLPVTPPPPPVAAPDAAEKYQPPGHPPPPPAPPAPAASGPDAAAKPASDPNAAAKAAAPKAEAEESAAVKATANAIAQPAKVVVDRKNPPELRIIFKTTETTIPLTVSDELNKMAKQLIQNDNQRVTLIAYASAAGDQVSTARRISLSRALSVRAFLIDAGVNNLRINVQAEGDKNPGGEADRVDLYVQNTEAAK